MRRGRAAAAATVVVFAAAMTTHRADAQTLEITPTIGYETAGSYPPTEPGAPAALRADAARVEGVFVDYRLFRNLDAEFAWVSNSTTYSQQDPLTGAFSTAFSTRINQFQFGGLYHLRDRDAAMRPYVVGSLGFTHDGNGGAGDRTSFAFGLGGGAKFEPSRYVGARIEARWLPTYGSSTPGTVCDDYFGFCYTDTFPNYLQRVVFTAGVIIRL